MLWATSPRAADCQPQAGDKIRLLPTTDHGGGEEVQGSVRTGGVWGRFACLTLGPLARALLSYCLRNWFGRVGNLRLRPVTTFRLSMSGSMGQGSRGSGPGALPPMSLVPNRRAGDTGVRSGCLSAAQNTQAHGLRQGR